MSAKRRTVGMLTVCIAVAASIGTASADWVTTTVVAGSGPVAATVNPVTNKIYVVNNGSSTVTVIDGATNDTAVVATGSYPQAVAVNPVTNKVYVANYTDNTVTVIADAPANDTKVHAAFNPLSGDTTWLGRPALTGKGVNRSTPNRTAMMGVCNRLNTAQTGWVWATVTSGAWTDSIMWTYNWGTDSLIAGENFVCAQPLEADAGITNNEGMGTPFAGNLEVYPVYRIWPLPGVEEATRLEIRTTRLPTIVRGVLMREDRGRKTEDRAELVDANGRKVLNLHTGANDVRSLSPGVYFVREAQAQAQAQAIHKVVVTR